MMPRHPRMRMMRTPDDRFADLPRFGYAPRFAEVGPELRMAYLEAGPGRFRAGAAAAAREPT
jgi:hypothetical protein